MPRTRSRTGHGQPAFSLVELMIVCVVIALLVGILVPVLSKAYKTALATADTALIHQISMGCEAYNQVFFEYPISEAVNPPFNQPNLPRLAPGNTRYFWPPYPVDPKFNHTERLVGAAKLFATLSGFNTLSNGTGMSSDVGCNDIVDNWSARCGELTFRGILVSLTSPWGTEDKAYGPYYVPSEKEQTVTRINDDTQTVFASRFEQANPSGPQEKGAPILYYRANPHPTDTHIDPSGVNIKIPDSFMDADANKLVDSWEIYRYEDNYPITDRDKRLTPPPAPVDRWLHPFYAPSDGNFADNTPYNAMPPGPAWTMPTGVTRFQGITRPFTKSGPAQPDPLTVPRIPYNADSFILISPGPDGKYFTADDVTNFR